MANDRYRMYEGWVSTSNANVDGAWRLVESTDDVALQRREAASWVTKMLLSYNGGITLSGSDPPITLTGTARVEKDLWVAFSGLRAPGTKPATLVEHGISGAWRFSDSTDDTIVANIKTPLDIDITSIVQPTIGLGWSSTTTTGSAVWQVEYLWTKQDEDTTDAADGTLSVTSSASTTAEGLVLSTLQMANFESDDVCVHLRVKRLGADVSDTLGDEAELHGLCMKYLVNRLGQE